MNLMNHIHHQNNHSTLANQNNNLSNNLCNNCGKQGHSFYQCKLPIISYGIILFKRTYSELRMNEIENKNKNKNKNEKENNIDFHFLMIRRKDSFGYIDLIRGKYSPYNLEQVQSIVNEMSFTEKQKLLTRDFKELWNEMWGETISHQYKNEEVNSAKKFEMIKNGIFVPETKEKVTLIDLVEKSTTHWEETEWEFPKGRRNQKEKDLECALREFEEETGISQDQIYVIENVLPFEETFIGTNYKSYKHKYFIAFIKEKDDLNNQPFIHFQPSEVSKMEWKTLDNCLDSIRPYHLEKKQLIQNVYKVLQEYRLYL